MSQDPNPTSAEPSASAEPTHLAEPTTQGEPAEPTTQGEPAAPIPAEHSADETGQGEESADRPSFIFFGTVAAISLIIDIVTKAWAEIVLTVRPSIVLIPDHLSFVLAYNKGGAWGLLQDQSETVRLPFFLAVSVLAILFIISLYGKLAPGQTALKWGLPLVLGGALGNLSDRVTRASVIDFIDYRADWVLAMNQGIGKLVKTWNPTDHWPTFNVADISICIGVGLMAVDMFTSRRAATAAAAENERAVASASEPPAN